jgi:hypothetical protein
MTKKLSLFRELAQEELSLPLLMTEKEDKNRRYWIQRNPYLVYACEKERGRISVDANPFGSPIMLLVPSQVVSEFSPGLAHRAAEENIVPGDVRSFDPVGYAARQYVLRHGINGNVEFAYKPGQSIQLPSSELVAVQLYQICEQLKAPSRARVSVRYNTRGAHPSRNR